MAEIFQREKNGWIMYSPKSAEAAGQILDMSKEENFRSFAVSINWKA